MIEAIQRIEEMTRKKLAWKYVEQAHKGDHICYISNLKKFQSHYPGWKVAIGLGEILEQIIAAQTRQLRAART